MRHRRVIKHVLDSFDIEYYQRLRSQQINIEIIAPIFLSDPADEVYGKRIRVNLIRRNSKFLLRENSPQIIRNDVTKVKVILSTMETVGIPCDMAFFCRIELRHQATRLLGRCIADATQHRRQIWIVP